jgi:hypothetical protein
MGFEPMRACTPIFKIGTLDHSVTHPIKYGFVRIQTLQVIDMVNELHLHHAHIMTQLYGSRKEADLQLHSI